MGVKPREGNPLISGNKKRRIRIPVLGRLLGLEQPDPFGFLPPEPDRQIAVAARSRAPGTSGTSAAYRPAHPLSAAREMAHEDVVSKFPGGHDHGDTDAELAVRLQRIWGSPDSGPDAHRLERAFGDAGGAVADARVANVDDLPTATQARLGSRRPLSRRIRAVLTPEEQVVVHFLQKPDAFIAKSLPNFFLLGTVSVLLWVVGISSGSLGVSLLIIAFALSRIALDVISWQRQVYVVTDMRLMVTFGLLSLHVVPVMIDRVIAVQLHRKPLEKLFPRSTVELEVTGGTPPELKVLRFMPDPKWVYDTLSFLLDGDVRKNLKNLRREDPMIPLISQKQDLARAYYEMMG